MKIRVPVVTFSTRVIEIGGLPSKASGKTKPGAKSKKLSRNWLIAGAVVVILLVFALSLWRGISGPNYGDIAKISQDTSRNTALPSYTTLSTNYYTVNYPENYKQQASDINPAGVIDKKTLASHDGQTTIDITVKAAPYGGITEDSNYMFYVKNQPKYKLSNKYYHGEAVDLASSTVKPAEAAGMWLHNGFVITVKVASANLSQRAVDQRLKDLLTSIQFQQ